MVAKFGSGANYAVECFLFFGLKRQGGDLRLPLLKVFQLWPSCVPWNLGAVVTDGAGIVVFLFYLSPRDLETFSVIPETC